LYLYIRARGIRLVHKVGKTTLLNILDLRGGRNGIDPPIVLPDDQVVEAVNADYFDGMLGRRRAGMTVISMSGGTAFSTNIYNLVSHLPGSDPKKLELWGFDSAPIAKRLVGGVASWSDVTLADAPTVGVETPYTVVGASFNGKFFLAYDTTQDRLHCWDPGLGTPQVRRVGLAIMGSPVVADQGAGAYAAVLRYYRTRALHLNGTTVVRRSEPSGTTGFTPSGAGASARVTLNAAPGEQETHWEVEASTDNVTYYRLAQVAIATTFYDDSAATTTYSTNPLSDIAGTYALPTSARYIITDGNRLLMAGFYESGGKASRVWYTPVLGSSDQGDDERIPNTTVQKNWIDIGEGDGGYITGLAYAQNGVVFVFKDRAIWRLTPTGDVNAPYLARQLTAAVGCVHQKTIVHAVDENGAPAIYFLSDDGPWRLGNGGLQYLGHDVEDIWADVITTRGTITGVNVFRPFGVYNKALRQVWFWVPTNSFDQNKNDTILVFHVQLGRMGANGVRRGWVKHTGDMAKKSCATLHYRNQGINPTAGDVLPYVAGYTTSNIFRTDTNAATSTDDAGTAYAASITTKPIRVAPLGQKVAVGHTSLLMKSGASGTVIGQTIIRDWSEQSITTSTSTNIQLGGATRILLKIEGSEMSGADILQFQWGDGASVYGWTIDGAVIPLTTQEIR
jgi:hypothetical protein